MPQASDGESQQASNSHPSVLDHHTEQRCLHDNSAFSDIYAAGQSSSCIHDAYMEEPAFASGIEPYHTHDVNMFGCDLEQPFLVGVEVDQYLHEESYLLEPAWIAWYMLTEELQHPDT